MTCACISMGLSIMDYCFEHCSKAQIEHIQYNGPGPSYGMHQCPGGKLASRYTKNYSRLLSVEVPHRNELLLQRKLGLKICLGHLLVYEQPREHLHQTGKIHVKECTGRYR